jgi:hypothetical protein
VIIFLCFIFGGFGYFFHDDDEGWGSDILWKTIICNLVMKHFHSYFESALPIFKRVIKKAFKLLKLQ